MNILFRQRDSKQCRFQMPNDVWKWELKPQGFAILAYLCYLHTHHRNFAVPGADQIAAQLHMSVDMAMEQLDQLNHRGLINENGVPMFENAGKNFFSLPNEIFLLGLRPGELAVYSYLRRCEDRGTHQCWPSYKTIGKAVGMSENTVRKYTLRLEERGLLSTEPTEVVTATGQKRNGNLRYTLRPVQEWIAAHYDRQLEQLEMAATRQRAAAMQGNRGSL